MSTTCQRCGDPVSERFARVFGNNDDEVFGCLHCRDARDLFDGAAAGLGGEVA